mgnify:CR=1 FL=1
MFSYMMLNEIHNETTMIDGENINYKMLGIPQSSCPDKFYILVHY